MNSILSCSLSLTLGLTLALDTVAQSTQDARATHESMFGPSGAVPSTGLFGLQGGAPPLIGQTATWQLDAGGFGLGFLGMSGNATAGWQFGQLQLFLDPLAMIGSMPIPLGMGSGTFALPLPPAPILGGLDLAMQAVCLDASNNLAATNLVASNLGFVAGMGTAQFAFQFGPVTVDENSYYPSNQDRSPIVDNATANAKDYTIQGARNQGGGTLQIRNQAGTVVATIPPNQTSFSITLTVPPGGKLYFFNSSGSAKVNGVTWDVRVG